ncbi:hypothetical protein KCP75_16230 [Salmonella enterica subsp. enterica]|nr:hypothetical protein KCP75_16230 [Salmonella enterica subsp. enterica]
MHNAFHFAVDRSLARSFARRPAVRLALMTELPVGTTCSHSMRLARFSFYAPYSRRTPCLRRLLPRQRIWHPQCAAGRVVIDFPDARRFGLKNYTPSAGLV